MSLIARHLEENGIPTVVIATARDIVEHCGVPRLVHVDFPLGNPCGEPYDVDQQRAIFELALRALETATDPRTTFEAGYAWSGGERLPASARTHAPDMRYASEEAPASGTATYSPGGRSPFRVERVRIEAPLGVDRVSLDGWGPPGHVLLLDHLEIDP